MKTRKDWESTLDALGFVLALVALVVMLGTGLLKDIEEDRLDAGYAGVMK